jgi:L-ribulose-5-phosphate 4-epimerase
MKSRLRPILLLSLPQGILRQCADCEVQDLLGPLKQAVLEANLSLQRSGLVLLTWGNVSGIDRESGLVVIKPSGVEYSALTAEDMVVVNRSGVVVEGRYRPSSDTPTHLALYEAFPNIGGVAHTHSTYATMWAQAGRPIPCFGTTHADHFYGAVPCTRHLTSGETGGEYELETGRAIIQTMSALDPDTVSAILVRGHGPFTWGNSPQQAVANSIVLEEVAKMAFGTLALNPDAGPIPNHLLDRHFLRKHGKNAYYGQKQ